MQWENPVSYALSLSEPLAVSFPSDKTDLLVDFELKSTKTENV